MSFTSPSVRLSPLFKVQRNKTNLIVGWPSGSFNYFFKADCKNFPSSRAGCKKIFLGKRHAEDLALTLYDSVVKDKEVLQENFLFIPLEISRVVAALIHATTGKMEESGDKRSMEQIRSS